MVKKKVSPVVLLDMSKAFDSINHEILLNKLQDVSFSPFHITWFYNYLCERHQVIRINNELSDPLPVESGVPQCSILRPILLSIYVNDLSSVFRHCLSENYVSVINGDFLRILNWCFDNRLLLNPEKTQLVLYRSRQILSNIPDVCLSFLGKDLIPAKVVKYLQYIQILSNAATTHLPTPQAVKYFVARIISNTRKFDNVTPILKDLRQRTVLL